MICSARNACGEGRAIATRTFASGASSTNSTAPPFHRIPRSAHSFSRSTVTGASFHFAYCSVSTCVPVALIADRQRLVQRPLMIDGPALRHDGAQRVLQAFFVARLPANFDIGNQAEHCPAPVRSAPGVRVIQPLVARSRFALVHVAHHVVPYLLGLQLAGSTRAIGST